MPGLLLQIGERYAVDLKTRAGGRRQPARPAGGGRPPAASRTWCAPASPQALDDEQLAAMLAKVPGTTVHKDLRAFAEFVIRRDQQARGLPESRDSVFGGAE